METYKGEKIWSSSYLCIPESLVEEILSWLPPKSLTRFKCVSKSWNTLIHDPVFISKHLHNMMMKTSSSTIPLYLISSTISNGAVVKKLTIKYNIKHNLPIRCSTSYMKLPFNEEIIQNLDDLLMGSHCNGLICLYDFLSNTVCLCNPEINESRIISPISSFHNISEINTIALGIGYDSKAKDYKIIRIGSLSNRAGPIAELYTLGCNSWKEIEFDDDHKKNCSFGRGPFNTHVYCKGVYYWLVFYHEVQSVNSKAIISFDFFDEKFSLIQLPHQIGRRASWESILVWNNERLAVFSNHFSSSNSIEMWVMMDGSSGSSAGWTKHAVIIESMFHLGYPNLWRFWKSDELLIKLSCGGIVAAASEKLLSYNVLTRKVKELSFGTHQVPNLGFSVFVSYVKSLVSVKGYTQGNNISIGHDK